jgi:hypothetical protein
MGEIIFEVTEDEAEGGFVATALWHAIATQGETVEELLPCNPHTHTSMACVRSAAPLELCPGLMHPAPVERHHFSISLRVLLWEEEGEVFAHALEVDLLGSGATEQAALDDLLKALDTQVSFAALHNEEGAIAHPAPQEDFDRWEKLHRESLPGLPRSKKTTYRAVVVAWNEPPEEAQSQPAEFEAVDAWCPESVITCKNRDALTALVAINGAYPGLRSRCSLQPGLSQDGLSALRGGTISVRS